MFKLAMLLKRHIAVIVTVCTISACVTYWIEHLNPGYQESGTIAITAPKSVHDLFAYGPDLLSVENLVDTYMKSQQGKQKVSSAGGLADYEVDPVNESNEEFPYYKNPYLLIIVSSSSAESTRTTYGAVLQVVTRELRTLQGQHGVPEGSQVQSTIASRPGGPTRQQGSRVRVLLAVTLLTIFAALWCVFMLDRRRRAAFKPTLPKTL